MNLPAWLLPEEAPKYRGSVRENSERVEFERMQRRIAERMRAEELERRARIAASKQPKVKLTRQQKLAAECARLGETMEERRKRLLKEWYLRNIEKRRAASLATYHRNKKLKRAEK